MTTEKASGKGRPTPKRREAEKRRKQRVKPPQSRREANRMQREAAKRRREEARAALASGDTSKLGPRDAGPVRAFARDLVDSRRNAASLFLPAAILVFGLGASRAAGPRLIGNALLIVVVLFIAIDSQRLGRTLIRQVGERFPDADIKGLKFYAITRAMQIRRLRLPKARVKIGDKI